MYKFNIAGTEYGMDEVRSVSLESPLFDKMSVGNTCCAALDLQFWPKGDIPRMARIVPYIQRDDKSWYQLGEFWTDTRAYNGSVLHITAYDAMMKGETVWEPDQSLIFPMPMDKAVKEIARLMGVAIDSRTVLNDGYITEDADGNKVYHYYIDYPANDYTLREVLGYIAGAHAGNWVITNEGKLLLIPLFGSAPPETSYLVSEDGDKILFGGVAILV